MGPTMIVMWSVGGGGIVVCGPKNDTLSSPGRSGTVGKACSGEPAVCGSTQCRNMSGGGTRDSSDSPQGADKEVQQIEAADLGDNV